MNNSVAQEPEYNIGRVILISIVATIGGFLFGFDSGVINGTVDGLQQAFNSDSVGTGFNVASMLLGCAAGAFFAGRLADLWGRRTLLIISAFFFIISAWGSGISTGSLEFIMYRIIGGLAVGAASVISPAYIGEISPTHIRGRLITAQQIAIITGLFCAFVSNYFLAATAGSSLSEFWLGYTAWRWMFWIELIPAVTFFVALFSIPESPRYLVFKGRKDEAEAVLTQIFNKITAPKIVDEIDNSLAKDHHKPKLSDVIDKKTVSRDAPETEKSLTSRPESSTFLKISLEVSFLGLYPIKILLSLSSKAPISLSAGFISLILLDNFIVILLESASFKISLVGAHLTISP
jgi:SP family sugar:H+ symporter-like MFS transporter